MSHKLPCCEFLSHSSRFTNTLVLFRTHTVALTGIPTAPGIVIPTGLPNVSSILSSAFSHATVTPLESQSLFTTDSTNVTQLPTPRLPPVVNSTATVTSSGTSEAANLTTVAPTSATTTLGYLGNATSLIGSVIGAGSSAATSVGKSGADRQFQLVQLSGGGLAVGVMMILLGAISVVMM